MQAFPYPPQSPYGFMPGAMPPPWFGGPFPPYPQQPYGVQPNQWVNPQQNGGQGQQAAGDYGGRNKNQQGRFQQKKKGPSQIEVTGSTSLNYADTICEGCGEPGHLKAACSKSACCFICKASNHSMDDCPVLKRPRYIGSSTTGLGFYPLKHLRFGLAKEGVTVSVAKWFDDPEPVETLVETWIQVRGLLPPWCEWNIIDQAVSVCGLMKKVDWQSIFRNCAEVVRVEIICRDPNRIPAGRLFNFHGKLFQLQFTAEIPFAPGVQREIVAGQDGSNAGGGPGSGTNGMETDGRSEATRNITNSQSSGGSNQQGETGTGSHGRQVTTLVADSTGEEVLPGSEVYKLLLEKGAI
ncbi:hypothetical protein QYE76_008434 [Lolium multiflorum]|uniref:CCHC-type domain-containing protein n=1 Tax=Lolium multiflorum TaxID=4521 RepID=A0AAD8TT99_LOLMU|nr:hypothetical protein QYE76_008434 [Lolium multiflorum]